MVVVSLAEPAAAHYIKRDTITKEFGDHCLKQSSEISDGHHGTGGNPLGYSEAHTMSYSALYIPVVGQNCGSQLILWARPSGWLRVKISLMLHYTLSNGQSGWGVCRQTSYHKSKNDGQSQMELHVYWNRPCGHGWYSTRAHGGIKYNGKWHTGHLWPGGSHYL